MVTVCTVRIFQWSVCRLHCYPSRCRQLIHWFILERSKWLSLWFFFLLNLYLKNTQPINSVHFCILVYISLFLPPVFTLWWWPLASAFQNKLRLWCCMSELYSHMTCFNKVTSLFNTHQWMYLLQCCYCNLCNLPQECTLSDS